LKNLESQADLFGALSELTRVLPYAKTAKEAIPVYQFIFKCLARLEDESGREAWQEKFLTDFKADPEVCAMVYVDRGQKAYFRKEMNASEAFFRRVCNDYASTSLYADALFGLGLVLQEEQRYDAAIAEFTRIFSSNANEDLLDRESSEDYPNYKYKAALHISECFEATKDSKKALEYALMARDRYVFISYCKDCQLKTRQIIANRVKDLEQAVKKPNTPTAAP
jgi:tetratricopeptide (TPR) repeat protein